MARKLSIECAQVELPCPRRLGIDAAFYDGHDQVDAVHGSKDVLVVVQRGIYLKG
jgi:hypothetical protein